MNPVSARQDAQLVPSTSIEALAAVRRRTDEVEPAALEREPDDESDDDALSDFNRES